MPRVYSAESYAAGWTSTTPTGLIGSRRLPADLGDPDLIILGLLTATETVVTETGEQVTTTGGASPAGCSVLLDAAEAA